MPFYPHVMSRSLENFDSRIKAGVNVNLRKFKEGLKGEKTVMEHHQTFPDPTMAPRLVGNCLVCISDTNFQLSSNCNFKTTLNLQNFLFP